MNNAKHKVAIVKFFKGDGSNGCDYCYSEAEAMVSHITEWEEVEWSVIDEMRRGLQFLNSRANSHEAYHLIQHIEMGNIKSKESFYGKTIEAYREHIEKVKAEDAERKRKADEEAAARKLKRDAKAAAKKDKIVKAMQDEIDRLKAAAK